MKFIVAVDKKWGIGKDNKLLVSIPQDMKMFRAETMGKVLVMGRKTLESFPGKRPLDGRTNIVLTRNKDYKVDGAIVCHSLEELFWTLEKYKEDEVYCIGGATIYNTLLPYCDYGYVTKINYEYTADTFFPDLDSSDEFEMVGESEEHTYFDLEYTFAQYRRIKEN